MSRSAKELRSILKRLRIEADARATRNQQIEQRLLKSSANITSPMFRTLDAEDLQRLFEAYDELYFGGQLNRTLATTPLTFRVSPQMTKAGGKTSSWRRNRRLPIERLEIAVSSTLLMQTFADAQVDRTIYVTGLECHHRLDALMRVMEHELIHLAELLGWDTSSCTQDRFQTFAWQIFGHTDHRHALITPREQAAAAGVVLGTRVRFEQDGRWLEGIVNRVTRRATVLVPSPDGELFSDGRTYDRFYVAVNMLEPVEIGS